MNIEKRNIVLCVVFSIVSCGIYAVYWMYKILVELYELSAEPNQAAIDIVLSIVTCGIFTIYLNYKWGKLIDTTRRRYDLYPKDDSILFVVLSIFGLGIISMCIVQSEINEQLLPVAQSVNTVASSVDDDRRN